MAKEFHVKWACNGECELSKPDYDYRLLLTLKSLADATGRCFGPTSLTPYKKAILNRFSLPPATRFYVVDKELHGNYWLEPNNNAENQIVVYRQVLDKLSKHAADEQDAFDPWLEIFLWSSLCLCDLSALSTVLASKRAIIPTCIMSSLLSMAIYTAWEEGVDLLLENGASAEHNNARGPLNDAFLAFMRNSNTNRTPNPATFRTLTRIMKKLINHGATLYSADHRFVCNQRLHWVSSLAICDAEAVKVLLEEMPSRALKIPRSLILPHVDYSNDGEGDDAGDAGDFGGPLSSTCSALVSCLYKASQNFVESRASPIDWVKILIHGALPLLRAGAVCDPDPLERRRVNTALARLVEPSPDGNAMKTMYWGRPHAVVDLVLEIRQKNSLDVTKLQQCFSYQVPLLHRQSADCIKRFVELFRAQFPRSLQSMCRVAILKHLPVGATQRPAAIDKLGLPNCLSNYLNFSDLDVAPGIFYS